MAAKTKPPVDYRGASPLLTADAFKEVAAAPVQEVKTELVPRRARPPKLHKVQIGARVTEENYAKIKAIAALEKIPVQELMEEVITFYLENSPYK